MDVLAINEIVNWVNVIAEDRLIVTTYYTIPHATRRSQYNYQFNGLIKLEGPNLNGKTSGSVETV